MSSRRRRAGGDHTDAADHRQRTAPASAAHAAAASLRAGQPALLHPARPLCARGGAAAARRTAGCPLRRAYHPGGARRIISSSPRRRCTGNPARINSRVRAACCACTRAWSCCCWTPACWPPAPSRCKAPPAGLLLCAQPDGSWRGQSSGEAKTVTLGGIPVTAIILRRATAGMENDAGRRHLYHPGGRASVMLSVSSSPTPTVHRPTVGVGFAQAPGGQAVVFAQAMIEFMGDMPLLQLGQREPGQYGPLLQGCGKQDDRVSGS